MSDARDAGTRPVRRAWRNVKQLLKASSFLPLASLPNYRRLMIGDERPLVDLQVRTLGGRTVYARPRTADHATLISVFRDRYHLPPALAQLPPDPVILDLGCNCGYTVVHYKHLYPAAHVIGVELDGANLAVARRNVEGLRNVDLIHAAVSYQDGFVSYDKSVGEDAYRLGPHVSGAAGLPLAVPAISPRSLLLQHGLSRIDFAKIDVEGEEMNLFDPANDLDWLAAVRSLNMEVHADQAACDRLLATLGSLGFSAWKDDRHWSAIMAVRRSP